MLRTTIYNFCIQSFQQNVAPTKSSNEKTAP